MANRDRNSEVISSPTFGVWTAAKCSSSSDVPTEFAAEYHDKDVKDKFEGIFRNLNFAPFTRKTTEYSFELFRSTYRYLMFFFSTAVLSNNRFAKEA